jgi:hypothetical protein
MIVKFIETPYLMQPPIWTIDMEQIDEIPIKQVFYWARQCMIMSEIGTMDYLESCISECIYKP